MCIDLKVSDLNPAMYPVSYHLNLHNSVVSLDKMLDSLHRLKRINDQLTKHNHLYEVCM